MQAVGNAEIWIPDLDSTLIAHIYQYCLCPFPATGNVYLLLLIFPFLPCVPRRHPFTQTLANATCPQSKGKQEDDAVVVVENEGRRSREIRLLYVSYPSQGQSHQSSALLRRCLRSLLFNRSATRREWAKTARARPAIVSSWSV